MIKDHDHYLFYFALFTMKKRLVNYLDNENFVMVYMKYNLDFIKNYLRFIKITLKLMIFRLFISINIYLSIFNMNKSKE